MVFEEGFEGCIVELTVCGKVGGSDLFGVEVAFGGDAHV